MLGYAGVKSYAWTRTVNPVRRAALLARAPDPAEAVSRPTSSDSSAPARPSGVAGTPPCASRLVEPRVIGCGWQAVSQVACIRAAVPRSNGSLPIAAIRPSCRVLPRTIAPAELHREAADCDIVVTVTTSKDPWFAANGCRTVRSSVRWGPTTRRRRSSTTRCSSGLRSSVATRAVRRCASPRP